MGIALQVRDLMGNVQHYEADQLVRIGRDPSKATVVLDDEYVSRLHCVILRRSNGQWVIIHRGRNPSWLDGKGLRQPGEQAILPRKAAITVGLAEIEVSVDDEEVQVSDILQVAADEEEYDWKSDDIAYEDSDDRTLLEEEIPEIPGKPAHELVSSATHDLRDLDTVALDADLGNDEAIIEYGDAASEEAPFEFGEADDDELIFELRDIVEEGEAHSSCGDVHSLETEIPDLGDPSEVPAAESGDRKEPHQKEVKSWRLLPRFKRLWRE